MGYLGVITFLSILGTSPAAPEPARSFSFSDGSWKLEGENTAVTREGEREVLAMESGEAARPDIRLEDGAIDFDVRVTRRRSFVYLAFRVVDENEQEEVYLRPHKSGLPDALQYAPVWQGHSAWQLFHGAGGTAAVDFEPDRWTPVRLVLQGRDAALFVGDLARPALVARLARAPRMGSIALRAFVPPGTPGSGPAAAFSNVVVRPGVVPFDFSAARGKPSDPGAGIVRVWAVSKALDPKLAASETLPPPEAAGEFKPFAAESNGLLPLHRHVAMTADKRIGVAVARIRVRAAKAGPRAFDLGFSDTATVYVNGKPVLRIDASYSFDAPRREGLVGFDQARLFLPLEEGDNEIAVLLTDRFGGWGLMGRFADPEGLQIEAR